MGSVQHQRIPESPFLYLPFPLLPALLCNLGQVAASLRAWISIPALGAAEGNLNTYRSFLGSCSPLVASPSRQVWGCGELGADLLPGHPTSPAVDGLFPFHFLSAPLALSQTGEQAVVHASLLCPPRAFLEMSSHQPEHPTAPRSSGGQASSQLFATANACLEEGSWSQARSQRALG